MTKEAALLTYLKHPGLLWKWITARSRSGKVQYAQALQQEKRLRSISIPKLLRRQGLSPVWDSRFSVEPTNETNFNLWSFHPGSHTGDAPWIGNTREFSAITRKVKPTDTLLHEIGHAGAYESGATSWDAFNDRLSEKYSTALRRLLHPEIDKEYAIEDAADKYMLGSRFNWKTQLRHHPGIASYRANARIKAGKQLATLGLAGGAAIGTPLAYALWKRRDREAD